MKPRLRVVAFPMAPNTVYSPEGERLHQDTVTDVTPDANLCGGTLRTLYARLGAAGQWTKWGTVCARCGELWVEPTFTLEDILEGT